MAYTTKGIAADLEYLLSRKPSWEEVLAAKEWSDFNPTVGLDEYVDAMNEIGGFA